MPAVFLQRSDVCPIPFVELGALPTTEYDKPNLLDDWDHLSQPYWAKKHIYFQKWQQSDHIFIQFGLPADGVTGVTVSIVDCQGRNPNGIAVIIPLEATFVADGNTYNGLAVVQYQYNWRYENLGLVDGKYFVQITVSYNDFTQVYVSEPQWVKERWDGTCVLDYGHDLNAFNTFFSGGLNPNFRLRVEGEMAYDNEKYEDTDYNDQGIKPDKLDSQSVSLYEFKIGAKRQRNSQPGVPKWMLRLVSLILRCRYTAVNSRLYVRPNGEVFDIERRDPTPLAIATITLQEKNPIQTAIVGYADIFVAQVPSAPYAFSPLFLTGTSQTPLTSGQPVEILNAGAQVTFLAQLNALPNLTGTFSITGGGLYYRKGITESYSGAVGMSYAKHVDFGLLSVTGSAFRYRFRGSAHVTVYSTGEKRYVPTTTLPAPVMSNVDNVTPFASGASASFRIYHNDNIQRLYLTAPISQLYATSIVGNLPLSLTHFALANQPAFTSLDFTRINPLGGTLRELRLNNNGITDIDGPIWAPPAGQFEDLTYFDISFNEISRNDQDLLTFRYIDQASYTHPGVWAMDGQGQGPVLASTLINIQNLQNAGWSVNYDM